MTGSSDRTSPPTPRAGSTAPPSEIPSRQASSDALVSDDRQILGDRIRNRVGTDAAANEATAIPRKTLPEASSGLSKGRAIERELLAANPTLDIEAALLPVDDGADRRVVPEYVVALCQVLKADKEKTPTADDFLSEDGMTLWKRSVNGRLQQVLSDLLKYRYVIPQDRAGTGDSTIAGLQLKVLEARGLVSKEGRSRDAYCMIELGSVPDDEMAGRSSSSESHEVFMTEPCLGTNHPKWNQHLAIEAKNLTDRVVVTILDKHKDTHLGTARLAMSEIIAHTTRDGTLKRWCPLLPIPKRRDKDKYVGGEVLIEIAMADQDKRAPKPAIKPPGRGEDPTNFLRGQIIQCRVNTRSLYRILLRNVLTLDMTAKAGQINEGTSDLIGPEGDALLRSFARQWSMSEAFRLIAYVELLFIRYKSYQIPTTAFFNAMKMLYDRDKANPQWVSRLELAILLELLDEMYNYYVQQITKYKEFYPKNQPKNALDATLVGIRMIHRTGTYRANRPALAPSLSSELRRILHEASVARYIKLQELSAPLDESDIEGVMQGLAKLADLLSEDIDVDEKYFKRSFANEFKNIAKLTAETYLQQFVKTLQTLTEMLSTREAVECSTAVFVLFRKLRAMDERYSKLASNVKRLNGSDGGFNVEAWFAPFVSFWLEHLSDKTLEWVQNAIKADNYEPINADESLGMSSEGSVSHSSSIADLFAAVYQELEFITELKWSDKVQSASFFQAFSKTVYTALDQYCQAIVVGELAGSSDPAQAAAGSWTSYLRTTAAVAPQDIGRVSCVKLCNIQYALKRLDDMARLMNVASLTSAVRNHRATMMLTRRPVKDTRKRVLEDTVKGMFRVQIIYAENLKPCTKNGQCNGYVVIRVPEGTVVPRVPDDDPSALGLAAGISSSLGLGAAKAPKTNEDGDVVLTGPSCEIVRSRTVNDTVNPTWEDQFTVLLPPVSQLEVQIWSRNVITADDLAGHAVLEVGRYSDLHRRLADHQTHDVYVEMEPQGRVLLRLTLEGDDEDVDFWFRRTKERLGRTRDDFVRALTGRISPYIREVVTKLIMAEAAVPAPSRGFFSSLTTGTQYSNETAGGVAVDKPFTGDEADSALAPLTEYLDKNLETLCISLSTLMAQEVIKRTWDEALNMIESTVVIPLYGQIESSRRVMNPRQISLAQWAVQILYDFFHADGAGLGLAKKVLETRRYIQVSSLLASYGTETSRLRREYELALLGSREKEYLLRLIRFRIERPDEMPAAVRDELRQWFEAQLVRRKQSRSKS
ncbi:hypothetical protein CAUPRSCDRAFT_6993 [Caulochytrium protostelioides]|uniref:C2 domain-containing protein n=1 Tax=Caulochytrium protostelioides TaxID=1555241 RepID=A0A4P9WUR8_9FUNG|nr:hypothetical protein CAUPRSCDRAFT_6993 [Caulochytrium protostelioides]